jgi:NADH dehydrogenase [ubiquinone] 1 alpha subcomplex assembly factor 1
VNVFPITFFVMATQLVSACSQSVSGLEGGLPEEVVSNTIITEIKLEFHNANDFSQLQLIHDRVMGGSSVGNVTLLSAPARVQFAGNLSLENHGGFASVAFQLQQQLPATALTQAVLHIDGDGRTYQLRLKTPYIPEGVAYVTEFKSAVTPQIYSFAVADFTGRYRGRSVSNLPALKFADVSQISVMLADKTPGSFQIDLYSIVFKSVKQD